MKKEILEGNKLIAEFMGEKLVTGEYLIPIDEEMSLLYWDNELNFHKSWNWLMPVITSIEYILDTMLKLTHEGDDTIEKFYELRLDHLKFMEDVLFVGGNILRVYEDVVEFINWYNGTLKKNGKARKTNGLGEFK